MRWASWLIVVLVCAAVAGALAYYKYDQIQDAIARAQAYPEPREAVEIFIVQGTERQPEVAVTGDLIPVQSAALRTELAGRVASVSFAPGTRVQAGQMLLQLDVAQEKAQLAEARATEDIARLALNRAQRLVKSGAGSVEARDRARAEFDAATARSQALAAAIAKKTVTAPFDAIAGLHRLERGQYLQAGDVVTELIGTEPQLWIDFALPQEYSNVTAGTTVTVSTDAGEWPATIIARDSAVSTASRNLRLRARIDNPPESMLPGMAVVVSVPVGRPQMAALVPATSVRRDALGAAVYVLETRQGGEVRARKQGVQLAKESDLAGPGDFVVIEKGLELGQKIAANGAFKLSDGSLVNPIDADSDV